MLVPFAIDIEAGVTAMLVRVAAVTVMLTVFEVTPLRAAVMVVVPVAAVAVTTPVLAPTLAMSGSADVQVTELVMGAVVPFEYVPVAVRLVVRPLARVAEIGVTAIAVSVGAVTVRMAPPDVTPPVEAVMVLVPTFTPAARPLLPTVATLVLLEFQVTEAEILPVVLSAKAPVAVKVVLVPTSIETAAGATVMLVSGEAVTVMVTTFEVTPFRAAVTVVLPTATPVTTPVLPPTLAVAGLADAQVTVVVRLAVELSEKVPVAVRLAVPPLATVAEAGVMAMDFSVGAGVGAAPPPPLLQAVRNMDARSSVQ